MIKLPAKWSEWTIEELIGQGAYGKVYRIRKENMGNVSYAALKTIEIPESETEIKTLLNAGMDHLSIKSYFEQTARGITNEIAMLESLKSAANIVIIEDYDLEEKQESIGWKILIRMELLESLSDHQQKNGFLSKDEAVKLGIDIASALECCEGMKIIHRDVKPENVFVNRFGTYKLGDFGIAKRLENTTSAYSQKGTGLYMAPEVNRGEKYNQTVDIYSLGVMLYQFLNNQRLPFLPSNKKMLTPADFQEAVERRLSGEALPMPSEADEILGRIILKACDPLPAKRYQSASEFKKALQEWKEGHAWQAPKFATGVDIKPVSFVSDELEKTIKLESGFPVRGEVEKPYWKPIEEKIKETVESINPTRPESEQREVKLDQSKTGSDKTQADAGAHRAAAAVQQAQQPVFEQKPAVMPVYSSVPQKTPSGEKKEPDTQASEETVRDNTPYFNMTTMVRIVIMTFFVMLLLNNLFSPHEMMRFFYELYIKYVFWFLAITSGLASIPLTLAIEFLFEYLIRNVKRKDGTAYSMKPHRLKYLAIVGAVGMAACAAGTYLIDRNFQKLVTTTIFRDLVRNPDAFMFAIYGISMMALIISMLIINGRKRHD